jgi:putative ABC transport system ATP-binding protein
VSGPPLLELVQVARHFPPGVRALEGVSLAIQSGEFVAVMGRSGSGKSTLLHILGLLDRPTAGRYTFDGAETAVLSHKERARLRAHKVGFVFQAYHLIPHLTVLENVALSLRYSGVGRGERSQRSSDVLARLGMAERMHASPPTLSGGEQQRVAIARAVVRSPRLLLCDEPTGNLDSENAGRILHLLGQLRDPTRAIVVVTHDPWVAGHADRVIHIADGRIQEG